MPTKKMKQVKKINKQKRSREKMASICSWKGECPKYCEKLSQKDETGEDGNF
jgi:hypothetical protein